MEADVGDYGFGSVVHRKVYGVQETFKLKVQNISNKKILAFDFRWLELNPFASKRDARKQKFSINKVKTLDIDDKTKIDFKRSYKENFESFYFVEVDKVLFADGSTWSRGKADAYKKMINKQNAEAIKANHKPAAVSPRTPPEVKQKPVSNRRTRLRRSRRNRTK